MSTFVEGSVNLLGIADSAQLGVLVADFVVRGTDAGFLAILPVASVDVTATVICVGAMALRLIHGPLAVIGIAVRVSHLPVL